MKKQKLEFPEENYEYVVMANAAEASKSAEVEKVMTYKEAKLKAENLYADALLYDFTTDKKMPRIIAVKHFDGSYLEFHSASFRKMDEYWMAIFTEHHGFFVYHYEDVCYIKELEGKELYQYEAPF